MDTEKKQLELDKRYIRMANIWAENSYCQRRKVGALIVKDKMIISDGLLLITSYIYLKKAKWQNKKI